MVKSHHISFGHPSSRVLAREHACATPIRAPASVGECERNLLHDWWLAELIQDGERLLVVPAILAQLTTCRDEIQSPTISRHIRQHYYV